MSEPTEPPRHVAPDDEPPGWLERPGTVNAIYWALWVICAGLGAADFLYHKHTECAVEEIPAVYGFYGFVCFFFIVLAGKQLRKLIMRDERYYD
jgi:hypothetical protein